MTNKAATTTVGVDVVDAADDDDDGVANVPNLALTQLSLSQLRAPLDRFVSGFAAGNPHAPSCPWEGVQKVTMLLRLSIYPLRISGPLIN